MTTYILARADGSYFARSIDGFASKASGEMPATYSQAEIDAWAEEATEATVARVEFETDGTDPEPEPGPEPNPGAGLLWLVDPATAERLVDVTGAVEVLVDEPASGTWTVEYVPVEGTQLETVTLHDSGTDHTVVEGKAPYYLFGDRSGVGGRPIDAAQHSIDATLAPGGTYVYGTFRFQ